MSLKTVITAALALGAVACASQSQAQAAPGWRLNPAACPDLREDIRDARVTRSRRDLREDRRDRRVTNCPASAFVFVGSQRTRKPPRPHFSAIYVTSGGTYYGIRSGRRVPILIVER
ncbi:hypothetical protein [Parvularcula lutaonensis]|uniref:Uncharacterized protein n=1 Tax=Parvularcula lutaonensis TaxID=491923 RepID=A0ABV7MB70_9PROT|nr:hypothetical protein [Parvularcula lutaonensis]GGY39688.1 hypothetical protein GCM10007148_05020 [Parvularcula lutaonensis]